MASPLIFTRPNGSPAHWRLRIEETRSILRLSEMAAAPARPKPGRGRISNDVFSATAAREDTRGAMSVPDEFREKARKCFERAKCAPDSEYQKLFRDLAVQWLALAIEADAGDPPELPSGDEGKAAGKSGGSAARSSF
jgi:hypothetical protein